MPAIALFDMDGTLFDHDKALKRDMLKICSPEEIEQHDLESATGFWHLEHLPHMKERITMIRKIPGWWRELERYEPGWDILKIAQEIGFCPKILTKGPKKKPMAWMEKVQCIHDHFGDDMPIDIAGKDKGGVYGRVLVDDYPPYLEDWLTWRKRGLAIMPAHSYNSGFTHSNVIRYTGDNLEEVKCALLGAYQRESKEHWKDYI